MRDAAKSRFSAKYSDQQHACPHGHHQGAGHDSCAGQQHGLSVCHSARSRVYLIGRCPIVLVALFLPRTGSDDAARLVKRQAWRTLADILAASITEAEQETGTPA